MLVLLVDKTLPKEGLYQYHASLCTCSWGTGGQKNIIMKNLLFIPLFLILCPALMAQSESLPSNRTNSNDFSNIDAINMLSVHNDVDPTVYTYLDNITEHTAYLGASITNPSNVTISAMGFEWKTTVGGNYTQITSTSIGNHFYAELTDLSPLTSYTFRAFIIYNGNPIYGNEVVFTTLEECNPPTNVSVSNIRSCRADVSWSAAGDSWHILYKENNSIQWNVATCMTTTYHIEGLNPASTYIVQVQAVCNNGDDYSEFSDPVYFTTLDEQSCDAPTNLHVSSISIDSVTIAWTANGNETEWYVNYTYEDSITYGWHTVHASVQQPSYTIHDLPIHNQNLYMEVVVQSRCECSLSEYSPTFSFYLCEAPSNLHVTSISTDSVTFSWTAGGTETSWRVSYGLVNESDDSEEPNVAIVQQPNYTITNPIPDSQYYMTVRALCDGNLHSNNISTTFTTLPNAINKVNVDKEITIWPNPVEQSMEISANSNLNIRHIEIYNTPGQLLKTFPIQNNHAHIDISTMPAGIYFVRIFADEAIVTKTFVKK